MRKCENAQEFQLMMNMLDGKDGVTLSKYGHDALNICRPTTDILRYNPSNIFLACDWSKHIT